MNKILKNFTRRNKLIKTVRFKLTPKFGTEETIKKSEIFAQDELRSQNYDVIKNIIDQIHRDFIDEIFAEPCNFDFEALAEISANTPALYSFDEKREEEGKLRSKIAKFITSSKDFKDITSPTQIIKIAEKSESFTEEEKEIVKTFDKFTGYIRPLIEIRNYIYNEEEKSSTIPYRIVNENFEIYLNNSIMLTTLSNAGIDFEYGIDCKEINNYNYCFSQTNIDNYNEYVGTVNQRLNEMKQKHQMPENPALMKLKLKQLKKQILSESTSFIIDEFNDYEELERKNKEFMMNLLGKNGIIDRLNTVFELSYEELSNKGDYIYINKNGIVDMSLYVAGRWNIIENCIRSYYVDQATNGKKLTKAMETSINKKLKAPCFTLAEIQNAVAHDKTEEIDNAAVKTYFYKHYVELRSRIIANQKVVQFKEFDNISTDSIRKYLDAVLELQRYIKTFIVRNVTKAEIFYDELDACYDELSAIVPLYNKTRNYITKKPYSKEKFRCTFGSPVFGEGWDENSEQVKLVTMFKRDGYYYLGINNPKKKYEIAENYNTGADEYFEKMVLKTFDFTKQFPKIVFAKAIREHFIQSDEDFVIENDKFIKPLTVTKADFEQKYYVKDGKIYERNSEEIKYTKPYLDATNDHEGYYEAIKQRIELSKRFLASYKSTYIYNLSELKADNEYQSWKEFTDHVGELTYKIRWQHIPVDEVQKWINEEKLYMFKIDKRDFNENINENHIDDEQTLLFKEALGDNNARQRILQVLGGAEVYYRKASIKPVITHKAGSILLNKKDVNNKPIDDAVYTEIYQYLNGKKVELSSNAKIMIDKKLIRYRKAEYDIIKDKRYTEDQISFHLPIAINYRKPDKDYTINQDVQKILKENQDINILGINRGERNLIYITIINQNKEILYQKSLNVLQNYDWYEKLQQREMDRDNARKNWHTIEQIKNIKKGYIDNLLHEITTLMFKYNAIIAIEDINFGFAQKRTGISEKSIYMKFEEMLLKKLNYLVVKNRNALEPGGIINGYQMTPVLENMSKIGKQAGWVFFVPTYYISNIDPLTGYVNLLRTKDLKTIAAKEEFFQKLTTFHYNKESKNFIIDVDYKKFNIENYGKNAKWKLSTQGERTQYDADNNQYVSTNITDELKKIFGENNINYQDGHNLIGDIVKAENITQTKNSFFDKILNCINLTVKMVNLSNNRENDYIISPVKNQNEEYFDTRYADEKLPQCPDANGAYNIALKGLLLIQRIQNHDEKKGKIKLAISNNDWLSFMQN